MNDPAAIGLHPWREKFRLIGSRLRPALPFAFGVLSALVALILYNNLFPPPPPLTSRDVNETINQVLASVTPGPAYSSQVYQAIIPSLVLIQSQSKDSAGKEEDSLGSGTVIDDQGDILTSLHVVDGADNIILTFADGTESPGQVIATQPDHDIAVLRAVKPPDKLYPAVLGNPHAMHVGDDAYVVGNPLGLYGSMTTGVISGFDRTFRPPEGKSKLEGLIQIDAAVNPGNSGGPLLNRDGQVVGVITGIVNPTGQDVFIGIGFAVPIDIAGGAAGSPPY